MKLCIFFLFSELEKLISLRKDLLESTFSQVHLLSPKDCTLLDISALSSIDPLTEIIALGEPEAA